jgi:hypothetical protein
MRCAVCRSTTDPPTTVPCTTTPEYAATPSTCARHERANVSVRATPNRIRKTPESVDTEALIRSVRAVLVVVAGQLGEIDLAVYIGEQKGHYTRRRSRRGHPHRMSHLPLLQVANQDGPGVRLGSRSSSWSSSSTASRRKWSRCETRSGGSTTASTRWPPTRRRPRPTPGAREVADRRLVGGLDRAQVLDLRWASWACSSRSSASPSKHAVSTSSSFRRLSDPYQPAGNSFECQPGCFGVLPLRS